MDIDPVKIVERIGGLLVPPDIAETKREFWYHLRVAIVACMGFLGLITFMGFSFGFIPNVDGFARSTDIKALTRHVLDNEILDLRVHHCEAKTDESKTLYWTRISNLMAEYTRVTGQAYPLPQCSDL